MHASPSPNDLGRQAGAPDGGRPAPRTGKRPSRFLWRASDAVALAVTLAAVVALTGCGASSSSTSVSTSIAGTWVGTGTVTYVASTPLAYYLDLTTDANNRITGTGTGCTWNVRAQLTISGAPGNSKGDYTMDWTTEDLGPGEHTLQVSAHISGSQMTLSGIDTSTTPPTTSRASLTHGSKGDFGAKCQSLPAPTPSP